MNFIQTIRRVLGKQKTKIWRKFGWISPDWQQGLPEEVAFWADALKDPATKWNLDEYKERTNPDFGLQQELRDLLIPVAGRSVKILDVGAGPLTRVGKKWEGHDIEIVATDPLADEYGYIFKQLGLVPLVSTIKCEGEKLTELFTPGTFDLAYASNSLDHSHDPMVVIQKMLDLVKEGGSVYLWHFSNCGINERYKGLHQWNFSRSGDDLKIDNGITENFLKSSIQGWKSVRCSDDHAFGSEVVIAIISK